LEVDTIKRLRYITTQMILRDSAQTLTEMGKIQPSRKMLEDSQRQTFLFTEAVTEADILFTETVMNACLVKSIYVGGRKITIS
jgi:hypothetical protein